MDSRDKFAQMLREGYETLDPEKEQREYIRELLRQKEQQRKRRIKTITAVAAAFLIVVGAALAVGGCFGSVEADKNDRTKVEEQDGSVVISDENADGQEVGSESVIETDWNKVDKLKEKYPEMLTFTDVPKGMEFVSVEVKEKADSVVCITYIFEKKDRDISLIQRYYNDKWQETQGIDNYNEVLKYKNKDIYIYKKADSIMAESITENSEIDIVGITDEEELITVLDYITSF